MRLAMLVVCTWLFALSVPFVSDAQQADLPAAASSQAPAAGGDAAASTVYPGGSSEQASGVSTSGLPERTMQARTLRAHWHVYVAFAITWLLLFGYALSLGRRFGRLDEEVERLRRPVS